MVHLVYTMEQTLRLQIIQCGVPIKIFLLVRLVTLSHLVMLLVQMVGMISKMDQVWGTTGKLKDLVIMELVELLL